MKTRTKIASKPTMMLTAREREELDLALSDWTDAIEGAFLCTAGIDINRLPPKLAEKINAIDCRLGNAVDDLRELAEAVCQPVAETLQQSQSRRAKEAWARRRAGNKKADG